MKITRVLFFITMIFASACSTISHRGEDSGVPEARKQKETPEPGGPEKKPQAGSVTDKIIQYAEELLLGGEHEKAAIELENAARISPKRAEIYLKLGEVRYGQKRCRQARGMARKAKQLGLTKAFNILKANTIISNCPSQ